MNVLPLLRRSKRQSPLLDLACRRLSCAAQADGGGGGGGRGGRGGGGLGLDARASVISTNSTILRRPGLAHVHSDVSARSYGSPQCWGVFVLAVDESDRGQTPPILRILACELTLL